LVLKLEGKLLGPWTGELLAQLPQDDQSLRRVRLDLLDVSFVDAAGATLLRELVRRGVVVDGISSFVAELLHTREA
jgi:ABC-type transporter Mla MlaB component